MYYITKQKCRNITPKKERPRGFNFKIASVNFKRHTVHSTLWKYSTCRNSARILSISSERIGIYLTINLAALIQVSIEAFDTTILKIWNIYVCAHCSFSLLQYIIKQVSWDDMNLKLTLEILFDKWSSLMIYQIDHGAFLNIGNSNKLQTL